MVDTSASLMEGFLPFLLLLVDRTFHFFFSTSHSLSDLIDVSQRRISYFARFCMYIYMSSSGPGLLSRYRFLPRSLIWSDRRIVIRPTMIKSSICRFSSRILRYRDRFHGFRTSLVQSHREMEGEFRVSDYQAIVSRYMWLGIFPSCKRVNSEGETIIT